MNQNQRRQVAKISVFITSIFVIFLSITYAFVNMTLTGTKRQVITAGSLELEFLEGDSVTLKNAMPMYDEVGMIQDSFNFVLKNTGTANVNYSLKLIDITDSTKEKLNTNIVKYSLTKDETVTKDLLSSLNDNELDHGVISRGEKIHYQLRLWIDSKVEDNSSIQNKTLGYRIDVEMEQEKQVTYAGMMKARGTSEIYMGGGFYESGPSEEELYAYAHRIKNIVIEDKIYIPDDITDDNKWDISEKQDESIIAYIETDGVLESGSDAYKLHIQANGKIYANPDCSYLFYKFPNLNSITGLENIDTSNVTNMSYMFSGCNSLTSLDVSQFDTSKVTNMSSMFSGCGSLISLDLSHFDTSNVINMYHIFSASEIETLNLSGWDFSNLTDMNDVLKEIRTKNLNLSNANFTNILSFSGLFSENDSLETINLNGSITKDVTDMSKMFYASKNLQQIELERINTSNVTDMSNMFGSCASLTNLNLGDLNTSKVTNMSHMFAYCSNLASLDISSFDTSNVTNMSWMFSDYQGSRPLDLKGFNTSKVTDMSLMFYEYSSNQPLDLSHFDTSNVTNMGSMFYKYSSSQTLDLTSFDTSQVTSMNSMFYDYSGGELKLGVWKTGEKANMSHMFYNYSSSYALNLSNMDTSKVTDMNAMFTSYSSSQPLDLSNFNTSNVTVMQDMFFGYSSEASLDVSSFDFSKATINYHIFERNSAYCSSPILVKDEATKAWVLEQNSELTNVQVKSH